MHSSTSRCRSVSGHGPSGKPSKKKQGWNEYLTDDDRFKLPKEEALRRKNLFISKNNIFQVPPRSTAVGRSTKRGSLKKGGRRNDGDEDVDAFVGDSSALDLVISESDDEDDDDDDDDDYESSTGESEGEHGHGGLTQYAMRVRKHGSATEKVIKGGKNSTPAKKNPRTAFGTSANGVRFMVDSGAKEHKRSDKDFSRRAQEKAKADLACAVDIATLTCIAPVDAADTTTATSSYTKTKSHGKKKTPKKNDPTAASALERLPARAHATVPREWEDTTEEIKSLLSELKYYEELSGRRSCFDSDGIELALETLGEDDAAPLENKLTQTQVMKFLVQLVCQTMSYLLQSQVELHTQKTNYDLLSARIDALALGKTFEQAKGDTEEYPSTPAGVAQRVEHDVATATPTYNALAAKEASKALGGDDLHNQRADAKYQNYTPDYFRRYLQTPETERDLWRPTGLDQQFQASSHIQHASVSQEHSAPGDRETAERKPSDIVRGLRAAASEDVSNTFEQASGPDFSNMFAGTPVAPTVMYVPPKSPNQLPTAATNRSTPPSASTVGGTSTTDWLLNYQNQLKQADTTHKHKSKDTSRVVHFASSERQTEEDSVNSEAADVYADSVLQNHTGYLGHMGGVGRYDAKGTHMPTKTATKTEGLITTAALANPAPMRSFDSTLTAVLRPSESPGITRKGPVHDNRMASAGGRPCVKVPNVSVASTWTPMKEKGDSEGDRDTPDTHPYANKTLSGTGTGTGTDDRSARTSYKCSDSGYIARFSPAAELAEFMTEPASIIFPHDTSPAPCEPPAHPFAGQKHAEGYDDSRTHGGGNRPLSTCSDVHEDTDAYASYSAYLADAYAQSATQPLQTAVATVPTTVPTARIGVGVLQNKENRYSAANAAIDLEESVDHSEEEVGRTDCAIMHTTPRKKLVFDARNGSF